LSPHTIVPRGWYRKANRGTKFVHSFRD
jgi:hypothetical protein